MIDWGLPESTVAALVRGAGRAGESVAERDEAVARALWSVVVEPGDGDAGVLVGAVGAIEAARTLLEHPAPISLATATDGELTGSAAERALGRWLPRRRQADVVRAFESAARTRARLLVPSDPEWPAALDDLGAHAPLALWCRGDVTLLSRPSVALVGARAATGYGEHVAMELAAGAVSNGSAVVSGGAYGIDGMAHRAALASGGDTIAVLAGGVDRFYPAGHEALLTRIAQQGVVVSEAPGGTAPTRWRFLQRNRCIAALAGATIVVEAGRRSGALNTARHALDLGRPVGIVPGPVTSASSAGCHAMLRDYPVVCVTSVAEQMELLRGGVSTIGDCDGDGRRVSGANDDVVGPRDPDGMVTRVLDALRPRRAQSVEEIARSVGESPARIRGVLGALSLEDRVVSKADGWVRRGPGA
ncbi:DNA-processing protein DprA [Microcella alkalica]|uniref:DNA processing protein n=1 Tax=Microcella alkalica TaxID=355930 RepID=A0A839EC86_9MICO|nr:DNA-processing protein DprA [Microcella alkalica]MBA8847298.1 DNA processing protein [Microcella alkalica]